MKKLWQRNLSVFLVCVVIGVAIALLMKSRNESNVSESAIQDLQKNIIAYQRKNEELSNRNIVLMEYIRELEADLVSGGNETISKLVEERDHYAIFAGLRPATNHGLVIELQPQDGVKMKDSVIREFVNELYALGAQAVSVNEERKVATTEIRANHESIVINGTPFDREQTFVIKAIISPENLKTYVIPYLQNVVKAINQQLGKTAPKITITEKEKVTVPALREDSIAYQLELLKSIK